MAMNAFKNETKGAMLKINTFKFEFKCNYYMSPTNNRDGGSNI